MRNLVSKLLTSVYSSTVYQIPKPFILIFHYEFEFFQIFIWTLSSMVTWENGFPNSQMCLSSSFVASFELLNPSVVNTA